MVSFNSFVSGRETYFPPMIENLSEMSSSSEVLCASPYESSAELESYTSEELFND